MKMTLLIGLPASGKTTYALENRGPNDVIVCRDDLRMMNYGVWHGDPIDENFITKQEKQMIISAFENGQNVISPNTNLNKTNVQRLVNLAAQFGAEVEYIYFELPPATCIEYDKHRDKKVGAKVINRMARKAGINDKGWIPKHDYYYHEIREYDPANADSDLNPVIVVDLDGTVAMKSDRSPYDYSRVYEDSVVEDVMEVVQSVVNRPEKVDLVFLSGRNENCREQTTKWIDDKLNLSVPYDLHMRPSTEPNDPDFYVKDRLFEKHLSHRRVYCILDDRRQVVQCWRTKGVTCLDVAGNKF